MTTNVPVDERALSRDEIFTHIRDNLLRARPDLIGIIAFGSFARGDAWRDVDVLAVLPTLESDPAAWTGTSLALRRAIDLRDVEVIPYSQRGFVNGLRNHSPFVLDIAVDGIVLHDQANLSEEIAIVKRYIQERGIRRTRPGSWRFPVQYRRSTPLSERHNEEYVRHWLDDAERDAEAAAALRVAGLHDRSVYHCQQAVERAVKACLACFGSFERTHFVARELREALAEQPSDEWSKRLERLAAIAENLEPHVSRARYIIEDIDGEKLWVPAEHYSISDSSTALNETHEALRLARDFATWWFGPVE
ncbi:MAG: HEPN domain-containing protein [Anaerolineae bacterium]